jgi:hypothetical protein
MILEILKFENENTGYSNTQIINDKQQTLNDVLRTFINIQNFTIRLKCAVRLYIAVCSKALY